MWDRQTWCRLKGHLTQIRSPNAHHSAKEHLCLPISHKRHSSSKVRSDPRLFLYRKEAWVSLWTWLLRAVFNTIWSLRQLSRGSHKIHCLYKILSCSKIRSSKTYCKIFRIPNRMNRESLRRPSCPTLIRFLPMSKLQNLRKDWLSGPHSKPSQAWSNLIKTTPNPLVAKLRTTSMIRLQIKRNRMKLPWCTVRIPTVKKLPKTCATNAITTWARQRRPPTVNTRTDITTLVGSAKIATSRAITKKEKRNKLRRRNPEFYFIFLTSKEQL